MRSQFIEQVQILMEIQQVKCVESVFGKSNYMWLKSKKPTMIWMSTRDEFKIRQAITKITAEQQIQVMKQLLTWLDEHPEASSLKIPEETLRLINKMATNSMITDVTLTRMNSFRNSLRRFSKNFNTISPIELPLHQGKARRSVTFNDVPIVYRITK